jgi:hypothetical protein
VDFGPQHLHNLPITPQESRLVRKIKEWAELHQKEMGHAAKHRKPTAEVLEFKNLGQSCSKGYPLEKYRYGQLIESVVNHFSASRY